MGERRRERRLAVVAGVWRSGLDERVERGKRLDKETERKDGRGVRRRRKKS